MTSCVPDYCSCNCEERTRTGNCAVGKLKKGVQQFEIHRNWNGVWCYIRVRVTGRDLLGFVPSHNIPDYSSVILEVAEIGTACLNINPLKSSRYVMYHHVWHSDILPAALNSAFTCFTWISEKKKKAVISVYSSNYLVVVTQRESVYCAVHAESL